jgi:hypothetical protein
MIFLRFGFYQSCGSFAEALAANCQVGAQSDFIKIITGD